MALGMDKVSELYNGSSDLTLSAMTLRNASLNDRIKASAEAGFQGIGWRFEDFTDSRFTQGLSEQDAQRLVNESGIQAPEIEFFREWVGLENDQKYQEREARILALASQLGAKQISVAVFKPIPQEAIVASLRTLCRHTATQNLIVQLEPMVYTPPVNSLERAWEIIRAVNEPNTGIVIDAWQWAHEDESAETLKTIPAERVTCIQLSDALSYQLPDAADESRHHRCIPGTGSIDLMALLRMLFDHGIRAPLSVEVMSDRLDELSPYDAARQVADGTRAVLRKLS